MDGLAVAGSCRRSLGVHTRSCEVCLSFIRKRKRGEEAGGLSRFVIPTGRDRTGSGPLVLCPVGRSG
jgi:hypothetical protein